MKNKTLKDVCSAVEIFKPWIELDVFKLTPFNRIELFLTVALKPGITMKEISKKLNMSSASVSRNVSILSIEGWSSSKQRKSNGAGLSLIMAIPDPNERRRKLLFLSPKGKELINQLLKPDN